MKLYVHLKERRDNTIYIDRVDFHQEFHNTKVEYMKTELLQNAPLHF